MTTRESAAVTSLNGLEHRQLKDRVYEHLRQQIIAVELRPGTALREVEIATSLGVSKTPVREAFVRLQKDRLVTLIPYRGAVVAGYSRADLCELYELRELLQGACARTAAHSISAADLTALTRNIRATHEAWERREHATVVELFDEFDAIMYRQSSNRWILDLIENLAGHLRRVGKLTVLIPGRLEASVIQHTQIHDAIVARDPVESERLMRSHIMSVMADQLAEFPDD